MTKENSTAIVAVLDRSTSMGPLAEETIKGFNAFLAKQKEEPGEAVITVATFSHDYTLLHDSVPLASVPDLNESTYRPGGWTALLDAVAKTINTVGTKLSQMKEEDRPSKILFLIMTDGEENKSREFTHAQLMSMVTHQREKYSWEFVFIGANIDTVAAAKSIGIAAANSYNFTASAAGSASLFDNVTRGVSSYRSSTIGSNYVMADPTVVPAVVPTVNIGQGLFGQTTIGGLTPPVTPQDTTKDNK